MDGGADRPAGSRGNAVARGSPPGAAPLVGRHDALREFGQALDASGDGSRFFLGLVGDPGAGKTRLLGELAADAGQRGLVTLWGRAAEFEQEMPFGVVMDALDDQVEAALPGLATQLGADTCGLLASVLPSLRAAAPGLDGPAGPGPARDLTGRYRIYRAMRRLLDYLAGPHGLVLILDDVHWADNASIELLDHLVRHPPRGRVLVAIAYRPAQASARLAALLASATAHGRQVTVEPLTLAETQELLGPGLSGRAARPCTRPAGATRSIWRRWPGWASTRRSRRMPPAAPSCRPRCGRRSSSSWRACPRRRCGWRRRRR